MGEVTSKTPLYISDPILTIPVLSQLYVHLFESITMKCGCSYMCSLDETSFFFLHSCYPCTIDGAFGLYLHDFIIPIIYISVYRFSIIFVYHVWLALHFVNILGNIEERKYVFNFSGNKIAFNKEGPYVSFVWQIIKFINIGGSRSLQNHAKKQIHNKRQPKKPPKLYILLFRVICEDWTRVGNVSGLKNLNAN